jgi:hypothetical protein
MDMSENNWSGPFEDFSIESLLARKSEMEKTLKTHENALRNAPNGKLRIEQCKNSHQYYHRKNRSDRRGTYLNYAQKSLAMALAQKAYNEKLVHELRIEVDAINRLSKDYHPERIDEIYRSLDEKRKLLVTPVRLPIDDFIKQWISVPYVKKGFDKDAPEFCTARGERVRSKSEVMIADLLTRLGIPYRYEYPIHIAGVGILYPDFTCLNARTRKVILLEHFGMLSDSAYADATVNKLEKYIAAGYFPGINFIFTFETASRPLNSRITDQIIKRYLL